jgi:acyl-[acyl carrier protein]--UDP-N-acetylglucosamine O-acyltransferase
VGLRRAGFGAEERLELKRVYQALFRAGENVRTAAAKAREKFLSPAARTMLEFIAAAGRGVCQDAGTTAGNREEPTG